MMVIYLRIAVQDENVTCVLFPNKRVVRSFFSKKFIPSGGSVQIFLNPWKRREFFDGINMILEISNQGIDKCPDIYECVQSQ